MKRLTCFILFLILGLVFVFAQNSWEEFNDALKGSRWRGVSDNFTCIIRLLPNNEILFERFDGESQLHQKLKGKWKYNYNWERAEISHLIKGYWWVINGEHRDEGLGAFFIRLDLYLPSGGDVNKELQYVAARLQVTDYFRMNVVNRLRYSC